MSRFNRDSKIKVLKKEYLIEDLLESLVYYPAEEVREFFMEINLSFPRIVRIKALRTTLREPVLKTREERATLADEMNYRLSWFNQYTESQLVNLFDFYKDNDLAKDFLEELWVELINYAVTMKIAETDFDRLIKASKQHFRNEKLVLPNIVKYSNELNSMFYDERNKIDGLSLDVIRPVLYKSSTLTEIRKIGNKYGVKVPTRLKKSELLDIIIEKLKDRDEYTEAKEKELRGKSVLLIQRFAKVNNIKASTELTKEEVIEYILSNAKETEATYFPPSDAVYDLEAEDVGEAMPEVQTKEEEVEPVEVTEDVVEEVAEEVAEEVIEELPEDREVIHTTEKVVYVDRSSDDLKAELARLEEEVNYLKTKQEPIDVERTEINSLQYTGKKAKRFVKDLNSAEAEEEVQDTNDDIQQVYVAGFANQRVEKKRNPLWAVVRVLLIVLLMFLILLLIYGIIRPVGGYAQFEAFDKIFNAVKVGGQGLLDWYTETIRGLFT